MAIFKTTRSKIMLNVNELNTQLNNQILSLDKKAGPNYNICHLQEIHFKYEDVC